jgi:hypothetical protein
MPEEQFDQNFTWYEWSFVSPGQVPDDDLDTSFTVETRTAPHFDPGTWGSPVSVGCVRDEEPRWMM